MRLTRALQITDIDVISRFNKISHRWNIGFKMGNGWLAVTYPESLKADIENILAKNHIY
ncbi:hypothetical protein [Zhenhengia yiwuensis]|uniref:hypothetical protein n=1 Tax=Zhenhengia yiwuensis TaxID=2763666 RepID=UPI002A76486B|nr:hypothetical protein [Zhenhengia yiwuensis]MDY3366498.1 hypothetical protein [Zhenhengia yiwuensis]